MDGMDDVLAYGVEPAPIVWRVSRARYASMQIPPIDVQGTGRFDDTRDSSQGEDIRFGVLYCGETPRASFIEVLAPLRENISTILGVESSIITDVEERDTSSALIDKARSVVSTRWRSEWVLTSATVTPRFPVFDLADAGAVQLVRHRLALTLLALGISDLDFSHILGSNRNLTSGISRWIWSMRDDASQPLFSGIRYRSRFDPECICLALYQDRYLIDGEIDIQPVTSETPGFREAAATLRLSIG